MPPKPEAKPASRGLVMATVLFYLVAALSMVMANKWVLNNTAVPQFFLLVQVLIAVLLFLLADALRILPIPKEMNMELVKGLWPMAALSVLGLSFSNYTLKYVDASFYQVARGMVLPFTVLTSAYFLSSRPSTRILSACGIVTAGFFVGVFLDGTPVSFLGVFFGVLSSSMTAIHAVVIKKSLDVVGGSALALSWYTNLFSLVLLVPLVVIAGEVGEIVKLFAGDAQWVSTEGGMSALRTFIWGSAITGSLGFLMGIASFLSIKITSPITHMISSATRGVAASLLGMWLFHDIISTGRAASIATILGGSIYYTWVKHQESQPSKFAKYERVPLDDVEAGAQSEKQPA